MTKRTVTVDPKPFECIPHWLLFDPDLTSNALRVWLILQKHRNYETHECWPGRKTLAELCNLSIKTIDRSISILERIGAITVTERKNPDGSHQSNLYQVHWDRWGNSDATLGSKMSPGVGTETTHKQRPISKQDPKNTTGDAERPEVEALCQLLADRIQDNHHENRRPDINKGWRDAARRMIDIDKRTIEHITGAIEWSQKDDFWSGVILSMPNLRKHWAKMEAQATRNRKASASSNQDRNHAILDRFYGGGA